jgi:arylsulfatase A-like enzyme
MSIVLHRQTDALRTLLAVTLFVAASGLSPVRLFANDTHPNILWLSAEDHGPHLGCYGDTYATTPNVDAFAKRAFRYTNALSTAPVCAPARTTIISGMYAPSLGAHHMRSQVTRPAWHRLFTEYLRDAGYYATNYTKTDYNLEWDRKQTWDDSSKTAHYRNRPAGKPFFAVFNQGITHESRIRDENPNQHHDPAKVTLPPYHPDTPEVRKDWAQYYDRLTEMDTWFAKRLAELEEAGLADDTIVFFWADHGSGMPRGKRYAGFSGVHVPLIVHIPEKFKHLRPANYQAGGTTDRLVGFVDFAPTTLSLAGIEPPKFHQGHAFLGTYVTPPPKFGFGFRGRMDERPDSSRSVYDGRFAYIRNFMPHLPHGQALLYQLQTPTTRVWRRLYREGKLNDVQAYFWGPKAPEELYDLKSDPHETRNLAGKPAHRKTLLILREALGTHMKSTGDVGILPEGILHDKAAARGVPPGMLLQTLFLPEDELRSARDLALRNFDLASLRSYLTSPSDASIRYWAVLYCLYQGQSATQQVQAELLDLLKDPSRGVQIAAAEALALHASGEESRELALRTLLTHANARVAGAYHAVAALNALDHLPSLSESVRKEIAQLPPKALNTPGRANSYGPRLHQHLLDPPSD